MRNSMIAAVAAAALLATPALAQNTKIDAGGGKGLVVVDVSNIDVEALNDLSDLVDVNDNTVQVPVTVAAALCAIEVNAIARSNDQGDKSCPATTEGVQNYIDSQ